MKTKIERKDCFMVWTKRGHHPRVGHPTKEAAVAEATRLAGLNPGKKYLVVHAIEKISVEAA